MDRLSAAGHLGYRLTTFPDTAFSNAGVYGRTFDDYVYNRYSYGVLGVTEELDSLNYGGAFAANGQGGGTNIGVYGVASLGDVNYAGRFEGSVYISELYDDFDLGYTSHLLHLSGSDYALHIYGDQGLFKHGGRIDFGDGGNVYLQEWGDDSLYIYATQQLTLYSQKINFDAPIGVGLVGEAAATSVHVKQNSNFSDGGIRLEYMSDSDFWDVWIDGANDYNFGFNGTLKAYILDTDGSYVSTSDRRLKEDIEPLEPVLDRVLALRPSTYRFSNTSASQASIGLIAQEAELLFPETVHQKNGYKGISYDSYSIIAIKAVQELAQQNDKLNNKIEALEMQVEQLTSKLSELLNIDHHD